MSTKWISTPKNFRCYRSRRFSDAIDTPLHLTTFVVVVVAKSPTGSPTLKMPRGDKTSSSTTTSVGREILVDCRWRTRLCRPTLWRCLRLNPSAKVELRRSRPRPEFEIDFLIYYSRRPKTEPNFVRFVRFEIFFTKLDRFMYETFMTPFIYKTV